MYGINIDDSPDSPIATKTTRQAVAIHWHWTTEYTNDEIADALGVTTNTVERYLMSEPNQEVKDAMAVQEGMVRSVAVRELKQQLREAGHRSRTAEKPLKVYETEDGDVEVRDVRDEDGTLLSKKPVPQDVELLPDGEARYYARQEVREILEQLVDITGAAEPDEVDLGGSNIVIHTEAQDDGGE